MTTGRLRRNVAGVLISTVDTEADLYDSTAVSRDGPSRGRSIAGRPVPTGGPGTGPVPAIANRCPGRAPGTWVVTSPEYL